MATLPPGFLVHLCPLRGCRKECKYMLNLSRQAAPCSLANGFPHLQITHYPAAAQTHNRKAAQQRTQLPIPYPASAPDHFQSVSSGNYLMKKYTISNKYNRELRWFHLQCKTNRVEISPPQNAPHTGSV